MPYPHGHYWVAFVLAVIGLGFWPSYWSTIGAVPWQFHAHGVAASLWVVLVGTQSWTAHRKKWLPLHRASGKASLMLFPFLIAGLFAIIDVTGKGYVAGDGPMRALLGAQFLVGMAVAAAAYVTLYYRALKDRRKVWLHSGYMLGTPIILFESPFSRVLGLFPLFAIRGPQDFDKLIPTILFADALALAFCLAVWWRFRERATPFLVTGAFVALQMAAMGLMGGAGWLWSLLRLVGEIPSLAVVGTGFAIGAATSWAGWQAGKRPAAMTGVAQPA